MSISLSRLELFNQADICIGVVGATDNPNLESPPQTPGIVNVVVPPEAALDIACECLKLDIEHIWLQSGAESPEVLGISVRSPT